MRNLEGMTGSELKREESRWQPVTLDGEAFLVTTKELLAPAISDETGDIKAVFQYDEYRHVETGTQIQVWKLGMDKPMENPALVRLDYGCPCMQLAASGMHLLGHDCLEQRKMAVDAIVDTGIGAIATISEVTAAGNGHGSHIVMEQSTMQYKAIQDGQPVPSMQQAYTEMGYFDDIRRHQWAAAALAHSIGTDREVIPTTSNPGKIQELKGSGLNVGDKRVELVTQQSGMTRNLNSRRRSGGYLAEASNLSAGPYIVSSFADMPPQYTPLTPETYRTNLLTHPRMPARRPS